MLLRQSFFQRELCFIIRVVFNTLVLGVFFTPSWRAWCEGSMWSWAPEIRKLDAFLRATLVNLLITFNELCVHVPKDKGAEQRRARITEQSRAEGTIKEQGRGGRG